MSANPLIYIYIPIINVVYNKIFISSDKSPKLVALNSNQNYGAINYLYIQIANAIPSWPGSAPPSTLPFLTLIPWTAATPNVNGLLTTW